MINQDEEIKGGKIIMNYILTAATAVSKEAGSMSEMLPKFGVIALVVVIILIGMFIYAKKKK